MSNIRTQGDDMLSYCELVRILARAKEEGYYELLLLELWTGVNRGEVLGLKWDDLNLANGTIQIVRRVIATSNGILVKPSKRKQNLCMIMLHPYMVECLAEMKKGKTCEWLFPSPVNEGEPRNPTSVCRRFKLILQRAGCKDIRFNDLRHTFATIALESLIEKNEPPQTVCEIGGDVKPYKPKIRKSGTGCITMINEHLYEGRYSPKINGKTMARNVYAKTREECEEKLADLIKRMNAEIARLKQSQKKG